eukprot:150372_1
MCMAAQFRRGIYRQIRLLPYQTQHRNSELKRSRTAQSSLQRINLPTTYVTEYEPKLEELRKSAQNCKDLVPNGIWKWLSAPKRDGIIKKINEIMSEIRDLDTKLNKWTLSSQEVIQENYDHLEDIIIDVETDLEKEKINVNVMMKDLEDVKYDLEQEKFTTQDLIQKLKDIKSLLEKEKRNTELIIEKLKTIKSKLLDEKKKSRSADLQAALTEKKDMENLRDEQKNEYLMLSFFWIVVVSSIWWYIGKLDKQKLIEKHRCELKMVHEELNETKGARIGEDVEKILRNNEFTSPEKNGIWNFVGKYFGRLRIETKDVAIEVDD